MPKIRLFKSRHRWWGLAIGLLIFLIAAFVLTRVVVSQGEEDFSDYFFLLAQAGILAGSAIMYWWQQRYHISYDAERLVYFLPDQGGATIVPKAHISHIEAVTGGVDIHLRNGQGIRLHLASYLMFKQVKQLQADLVAYAQEA